jgi:hypothetical protein
MVSARCFTATAFQTELQDVPLGKRKRIRRDWNSTGHISFWSVPINDILSSENINAIKKNTEDISRLL